MFTAARCTTVKTRKLAPECPSADEGIRKMWCICAVEYYAAVKKNRVTPSAATWVNLRNITLREGRQRTTNTLRCHLNAESKKEIKQMNKYANTERDPQILPVGRGKG